MDEDHIWAIFLFDGIRGEELVLGYSDTLSDAENFVKALAYRLSIYKPDYVDKIWKMHPHYFELYIPDCDPEVCDRILTKRIPKMTKFRADMIQDSYQQHDLSGFLSREDCE